MRILTALLIVAAMLFAGCSSKENDQTTDGATGDGTGGGTTSGHGTTGGATSNGATGGATSNGGTPGPGGSNAAPTGSLAATVSSGSLNVSFAITGTDADHDPLSWTLDANGDGTIDQKQDAPATLPATVPYTFAAGGNYTAKLVLSDGKHNVPYTSPVTVSGAAGVVTAIEELRRRLAPGGRIYLTAFNYLWELPTKMAEAAGWKRPAPTTNWLSDIDFRNLFDITGLEVVRFEDRLRTTFHIDDGTLAA
ncbi:MAG: hypothetical protein ABR562_07060, partial [Thermoplasmatota archaeon]